VFSQPVVFVVGAGASRELGLPTGIEMKQRIALSHNFNRGQDGLIIGNRNIFEMLGARFGPESADRQEQATKLAATISEFESIDEALHWFSSAQPDLVAIGKAAIVWEILQAEQSSKLFNAKNPEMIREINYGDTWLLYFLSMLISSLKREQATDLFRNVTIINFNYDRAIEHFLFNRLQTNFGLDREEAGNALSTLSTNMIRPYGSVGPLPWQKEPAGVPYGFFLGRDHDRLFGLAENVRTYTEQNISHSLRSEIGNALQNARLVVFLGFGFHQQNMGLLQAAGSHETWRRVIGTVHGIDSENWEFMKITIAQATRCQGTGLVQLLDRPANLLLSSMRPSLMGVR
jgi:hypothetical protein